MSVGLFGWRRYQVFEACGVSAVTAGPFSETAKNKKKTRRGGLLVYQDYSQGRCGHQTSKTTAPHIKKGATCRIEPPKK